MPAPVFIPFNAFRPDGGAFGPELGLVQNYLPVHAGWHSLREKRALASVTDGPMTGAYVHVYQQTAQIQKSRPSADSVDGIWLPSSGAELFDRLNEATPSDAEFIFAPSAPTAQVAYLAMSALTDPLSGADHFLRWRYRVPVTGGAWTVLADLVSTASALSSLERSGATATATTAEEHGLATGQVVLIEAADQPEYNGRFTITVIGITQFTFTVSGSPATPATGTPTYRAVWVSDSATGSVATVFLQREKALTAGEANAINDYAAFRLRVEATVAGAAQFSRPAADTATGGWLNEAGGGTSLFDSLNETSASDADYIESPSLEAGGASYTYSGSLSAAVDPATDAGYVWRFRYRATNAGCTLVARLKQGATVVKEITITNAATTFTTSSNALSAGEAALVLDHSALNWEAEASYPTTTTSTATAYARPESDVADGTWSGNPNVQPLASLIDEAVADDADLIHESQDLITPVFYEALLSEVSDPGSGDEHVLTVRARYSVVSQFLEVWLVQGSFVVAFRKTALTTTLTDYVFALTAGEASLITDYGDLRLRLNRNEAGGGSGNVQVSWAHFAVPEPRRVQVSWAELEAPSAARAEFSWAEVQVPNVATVYRGDVPTIFTSSKTKIYEVSASGFSDVSIAAGYGAGAKPGAGRFGSFGNDVMFTNRADPVQYRPDNVGDFADLITSSLKPKARFGAAVRDHWVLADINLTGYYPDGVWWSAFNNARFFDDQAVNFSPETQSDQQRIVSCPGQIMGLVGGDYGVLFKRNSMHLMGWVGGNLVFRFDDISRAVGTPYPSSIVSTPYGIFWFDGATFRRYNGGTGEQSIADVGTGVLSEFLTDVAFSTAAVAQIEPGDIAVEDQIMIGHWDPFARLIIWTYQHTEGTQYQHVRGIVYNPQEDRWGALYDADLLAAVMACKPNVTNSDAFLLKGTAGFDWNGTATSFFQFDGTDTYEGTFTSKRQALGIEGVEEPEKAPQAARLKGILPIFSHVPAGSAPPNLSVTVQAANDPWFYSGVQTKTTDVSRAAVSTGIMPCDVTGTWFIFSATIPRLTAQAARAFRGLYCFYDFAGSPGGL